MESGAMLRPWSIADAPAVLDAFRAPDLDRQSVRPVRTVEDAVDWLNARLPGRSETDFEFAIEFAGRAVGNVAVTHVERRHNTAWVSYWMAPAARGHGLATAAAAAVASWAFDQLGVFRLELGHRTNNPGSCRVAAGSGFLVEGLERAKLDYDGVRYDVELHARLRTDPSPELTPIPLRPPPRSH